MDIWCSQLSVCLNKQSLSPSAIPRIGIAKPTRFIDLPNTFQELLLKFMGVKCRECDTVPKQGGVCLLCGGLVCIASQCCLKNDKGEAFRVFSIFNFYLFLKAYRNVSWRRFSYFKVNVCLDFKRRKKSCLGLSLFRRTWRRRSKYEKRQNSIFESTSM